MTDEASKPGRKYLHLAITLVITAGLLGLAFAFVDLQQVPAALARIPWPTFLALLGVSTLFNVFLYADRWNRMLGYLGHEHRTLEVLRMHLGTGPLRLLFPIQTGEAIPAFALARKHEKPVGEYLGTLGYIKVLTLAATLLLLAIGLATQGDSPIPGYGRAVLVFVGILLVGLSLELGAVRRLLIRVAGLFGEFAGTLVQDLLSVFGKVGTGRKLFLLAYSVAFQFSEIVVCHFLFVALGFDVPFADLLVIVSLVMLVSSAPVTIAGTGTREALCLLLLQGYGDGSAAVAAGVAYSFIQYLWPMLAGAPWSKSVLADTVRGVKPKAEASDA